MTKVLPERRWIERCVDESLKQLTAGKHHIVVVKPRGTIEKDMNTWTTGARATGTCAPAASTTMARNRTG